MPPLPFDKLVEIFALSGGSLATDVPAATWSIGGTRSTATGQEYDHEGEVSHDYAQHLVGKENRELRLADGSRLKVIEAVQNDFVPHVSLRLREVRPGG